MIQFFRNLFFRDFWLKLFSLVLAILIWKVVSLAIRHEVSPSAGPLPLMDERTFPAVPVRVVTSAGDARSFRVEPAEVEVTVQGESERLQNLHATEIRALVDLTGIESAHSLHKRIEVSTPDGTTPARVSPDEVVATVSLKP